MEATQREILELLGIVLAIIAGGFVIAILLARTSVSRREARHRKISASRRAKNTSYDLFTAREKPEGARSGSRKRRRRHTSHQMIDILRHGEEAAADGQSQSPPGNSES